MDINSSDATTTDCWDMNVDDGTGDKNGVDATAKDLAKLNVHAPSFIPGQNVFAASFVPSTQTNNYSPHGEYKGYFRDCISSLSNDCDSSNLAVFFI